MRKHPKCLVVIVIEGIYDNLKWIFRAYGFLIQFREEQCGWMEEEDQKERKSGVWYYGS